MNQFFCTISFILFICLSFVFTVCGRTLSSCQQRLSCEACFRTGGCVYIYGRDKRSGDASVTCSNYKFIRYRPIFRVKSLQECEDSHLLQRINSSKNWSGQTQVDWSTTDILTVVMFFSLIIIFSLCVTFFCREGTEE